MTTWTLIQRLFSQPTAPFCEFWVLSEIEDILRERGIPYFFDEKMNLIAGVESPSAFKKKTKLIFLAHTDHPGFHIKNQLNKNTFAALWYGGAPFTQMKNAPLRIYDPQQPGKSFKAKVTSLKKQPYTREGINFKLQVLEQRGFEFSSAAFGAFDFPPLQKKGDIIFTRAADDLAGCAIAISVLLDLKKNAGKIAAVFTRAEEVGFVGTISLLTGDLFSKPITMFSIEASGVLPGMSCGEGPILRLGDRMSMFDADLSHVAHIIATEIQAKDRSFKFQRKVMDRGSCEASAFRLFDHRVTGLSLPLDNYHNQGAKGPAPECISLRDVENARKFCLAFAQGWERAPLEKKEARKRLLENFKSLSNKLDV
jgi:putative aminopeptidase FrvX